MLRKIAIVTDSTCDLPSDLAAEHQISIIPQNILWDGEVYQDGVGLTAVDFYRYLATASTFPATAPPSTTEFVQYFHEARAAVGADGVVAMILSSKLSNSFVNAQVAAGQLDFPVFVMDTQTVSHGLGFAVLAAAEARDQGAGIQQILDAARQTRRQTRLYFTVSTLVFLHRGRCIGGARHLIASALSLKPILRVSGGRVEAAATALTRERAIHQMLGLARNGINGRIRVGLTHGDVPDEAEVIWKLLIHEWQPHQIVVSETSPALGVHTGPGVLGIAVSPC